MTDAGISCAKMSKDNGEDFIVELGAYSTDREKRIEPRIGMLQVKGHSAEDETQTDLTFVKRVVDVDKLRRWAAHPNPVLLIAVELMQDQPQFFAEALDGLILEHAPHGLAELSQSSVTVTLRRRENLADFVQQEVNSFYGKNAFQLAGLTKSAIERNHYEVISRTDGSYPPTAKVRSASFRILWKGPWRPAHFWASLNHFADKLQTEEAGQRLPFMATLNVYRSYADLVQNNAVSHMTWVEERHRDTEEIKKVMGFSKPSHWARFRFNLKPQLQNVADHVFPRADDATFIALAGEIWTALDRLLEMIQQNLTAAGRVEETLWEDCHKVADDLAYRQIEELGFPSPQYAILHSLLQNYAARLNSVLKWVKGDVDVSDTTRRRWLEQDLTIATGLYKGFAPIEAHLSDRIV